MTRDWKSLYRPETAEPAEDYLVYGRTVMDHFLEPRNLGLLRDYDGLGAVGDPSCGDYLELTLKLDGGGVITHTGFLVRGCTGAIATSSMVTELARGRTADQASRLTDEDVIEALGGLPEAKRHCSLLGIRALRLAVTDALTERTLLTEGKVRDRDEYRRLRREGKIRIEFPAHQGGETP